MPKYLKVRTGNAVQILSDVDKIEAIDANGEQSLWIPEDSLRLRELRTAKPGLYNPVIGSYSKVTVEELDREEEDRYGVLEVTQNGIYEASKDPRGPFKGYTKVIVNIEPSKYPASIKVVRLPRKTVYAFGESINYDGIKVSARQGNSLPWTSRKYPDGDIPFDELSFELIRNVRPYKFLINQNGRAIDVNGKTVAGARIDGRRAPVYCFELYYYYTPDATYRSIARFVSEKSFSCACFDIQAGKYLEPRASNPTFASSGLIHYIDIEIPSSVENYSWNLPRNDIGTISGSADYVMNTYNISCDVLYNSLLDKVAVTWNKLGQNHSYTTYFDVIFN